MAPMLLADRPPPSQLGPAVRKHLLEVARRSIDYGLRHHKPLPLDEPMSAGPLYEKRATFVTLHAAGALRGCIGVLEPIRPLIVDVAHNAYAAAFRDPRFPPVAAHEIDALHIHISVLTAPQPLPPLSEQAAVALLRPGVDGLLLEAGHHRGTFLPAVWESLPEPAEFLRQLKVKAGLSPDHWSDEIRLYRYTTESVS